MPNEADTCRKFVVPKLQAAGWDTDPHRLNEQVTFTDGRIIAAGSKGHRRPGKRADYLLRYRPDLSIAVVEAKASYCSAADGLQQAKDYAEILGLKFAYATNGHEIVEFDFLEGRERTISEFPGARRTLAPTARPATAYPNRPRIGCSRRPTTSAASRRAITRRSQLTARSRRSCRVKSGCCSRWQRAPAKPSSPSKSAGSSGRRAGIAIPGRNTGGRAILYLADRNILIDDPKDKTFTPFGDARWKIENGIANKSREMYFAIYQAIAKDENRPGLYREYAPDFFDLIIVDECHRGSARDESNWREILDYFEPAYQIGMTATPKHEDNADTYRYFGDPVYTYSLRQGIDDGFLAPYRVHRVITQWDAAGWRPSQGELDRYGRDIPDEEYHTNDFEKRVALRARTECVAKHLTEFLRKTDPFAKTIVFCVDQEHAADMRQALVNLNSDLVQQYPDYVCRVTSNEGDIGRGHLSNFQDLERQTPVILTTSQMLTTGVDAPTCKNIVLVRVINSMIEFKQIIGRGTRVRDDYGKLFFNILDYTGSATRLFADPDFDGDPSIETQEEVDGEGKPVKPPITVKPEEPDEPEPPGGPIIDDGPTTAIASTTSTAATWMWPPTWSTNSIPTAANCAL